MATNSDEIALARGQAERFGLELLSAVADEMIKSELLAAIPIEWAREQRVLPLEVEGEVCLLVVDPTKVEVQQQAAQVMGIERPLRAIVAPERVALAAIERAYASFAKVDTSGFIKTLEEAEGAVESAAGGERTSDLLEAAGAAPVLRLVNMILLEAVKERASDIHFEPFEGRLGVRYRIDGVLYQRSSPPKQMEAALVSRLKVMARLDIAERRLPQDGMAQVRVGERALDIRVSTVPVADGERVVLRLLNRADALRPLGSLGMSAAIQSDFERLLRAPNGMIIVSGPTGSGKTTTLYAALAGIDSRHKNVLTVEDPIEYRLPDIGQIQVKPKIGLTFASGLRHILRQDPDVILVGETRDSETAEVAMRASLTGHLVFTTLHTNDAAAAVVRLMDMGIEPYLLAASLRGVLGQRLLRNICPECRERVAVERELNELGLPQEWGELIEAREVWRAVGCDRCLEGYAGRSGVYELMPATAALQMAIRESGNKMIDLTEVAVAEGMRPMLNDAFEKVAAGVTDLREVSEVLSV